MSSSHGGGSGVGSGSPSMPGLTAVSPGAASVSSALSSASSPASLAGSLLSHQSQGQGQGASSPAPMSISPTAAESASRAVSGSLPALTASPATLSAADLISGFARAASSQAQVALVCRLYGPAWPSYPLLAAAGRIVEPVHHLQAALLAGRLLAPSFIGVRALRSSFAMRCAGRHPLRLVHHQPGHQVAEWHRLCWLRLGLRPRSLARVLAAAGAARTRARSRSRARPRPAGGRGSRTSGRAALAARHPRVSGPASVCPPWQPGSSDIACASRQLHSSSAVFTCRPTFEAPFLRDPDLPPTTKQRHASSSLLLSPDRDQASRARTLALYFAATSLHPAGPCSCCAFVLLSTTTNLPPFWRPLFGCRHLSFSPVPTVSVVVRRVAVQYTTPSFPLCSGLGS